MDRTEQKKLQNLQRTLHRKHFERYVRVLSRVLLAHKEWGFVSSISEALASERWDDLLSIADSLSGQKYPDAAEHFAANQISLLIRKFPFPVGTVSANPGAKARAKFETSERRCKRVNLKHQFLDIDRSRDRFSKEMGFGRSWIRSVIGSRPNYKSISDMCDFGPGASIGVHGNATSFASKWANESWSVTPGCLHHGYLGIRRNYHLWESLLQSKNGFVCYDEDYAFKAYLSRLTLVDNNKICFVPKTAITDRSIAVEPLLNGFFQKGVDQELRKKLKKVGLDLRDQSKNQEFARLGSIDDSDDGFVTIDLESASDSLSIGVTRRLLPPDWYSLLDRIRSHAYELDGVVKTFSKFCSMGNGFCFPLETLVFASACVATGCGTPGVDFLVYGDDIVVRKRHAAKVIQFLNHLGFKTNRKKTFLSGPFRESCGKDWFGGKDVRPFTLDYRLDSLQNIFKFMNLTRRSEIVTDFFASVRDVILNDVPEPYRFFRPLPGEEDSGIDTSGDEHLSASSCWISRRSGNWRWKELAFSPCRDYKTLQKVHDKPWLVGVALRGALSIRNSRYKFLPEVTLRRQVETNIVRKGYVSVSNWLPTPFMRSDTP